MCVWFGVGAEMNRSPSHSLSFSASVCARPRLLSDCFTSNSFVDVYHENMKETRKISSINMMSFVVLASSTSIRGTITENEKNQWDDWETSQCFYWNPFVRNSSAFFFLLLLLLFCEQLLLLRLWQWLWLWLRLRLWLTGCSFSLARFANVPAIEQRNTQLNRRNMSSQLNTAKSFLLLLLLLLLYVREFELVASISWLEWARMCTTFTIFTYMLDIYGGLSLSEKWCAYLLAL